MKYLTPALNDLVIPIKIIESYMMEVIENTQGNQDVAFPHCIYGDFEDQRQLSSVVTIR